MDATTKDWMDSKEMALYVMGLDKWKWEIKGFVAWWWGLLYLIYGDSILGILMCMSIIKFKKKEYVIV